MAGYRTHTSTHRQEHLLAQSYAYPISHIRYLNMDRFFLQILRTEQAAFVRFIFAQTTRHVNHLFKQLQVPAHYGKRVNTVGIEMA